MRRFLSSTTGVISLLLALSMARASLWQWDRHLEKQELIATLKATLKREPADLTEISREQKDWTNQLWRRAKVTGTFDFAREMIVRRNRGSREHAGFHVVTPLKLDRTDLYVLVDRGFIPLGREERGYRTRYQQPSTIDQFGLIKASATRKLFSPADPPTGDAAPWADLWIRVNIDAMKKQLPYPVLPIYVELMESADDPLLPEKVVKEGAAGRNDVLTLTGQKQVENLGMDSPDEKYPIPQFDTTPPPDIHLGYVYEWAFMALLTMGIGFIVHSRAARTNRELTTDSPKQGGEKRFRREHCESFDETRRR